VIIGKFSRTSDGWSGTIQTLTMQTNARFVPNDKRESERAPTMGKPASMPIGVKILSVQAKPI